MEYKMEKVIHKNWEMRFSSEEYTYLLASLQIVFKKLHLQIMTSLSLRGDQRWKYGMDVTL